MLRGFFALWFSMLFLWVDAGDGGGADDDFLIDAPEPEAKDLKDDKAPEPVKEAEDRQPVKAELDDATQAEIDELKEFKNGIAVEKAIGSAVDAIKGDYPEFDIEKVSTFLQELQKTNPEKAESYNTPAGWEAVWLKNFASREEDGTFDPGRNNADEPFEFDKTRKEALGGNKKAMKKLFANAK